VRIAGTPPGSLSLKDEGDSAFERSRATALAKLESIVEEARSQRSSERLVEKLYEIKTGEQIKSVKLADLPAEWGKIARKRTPDERYARQCQSRLKQFADFVLGQNGKVVEIAQVTRTAARAFLDAEVKRGVTAKTWNDTLVLLRATFQHLLPAGSINPFSGVPTRETETVFRKPFTPEELKAILDAAQVDEFVRPVLLTGVCTAMRRGDCCLLKWSDVDLEKRFITVKTAKTGQTVSIPIFPLLFDELSTRQRGGNHEADVRDLFEIRAQREIARGA
jgi:integrase